jgi:phosphoglycerate kinase
MKNTSGGICVNDPFSKSHRKHAWTFGAVKLFDIRVAGLNLNREVDYLSMIKEDIRWNV